MSWSQEQMEAITARGSNLLVAAAAGSGKTSVLVERIIRMVTDPDCPANIDSILVVTFTNAAAAEMRSRIGAALSSLLKSSGHNAHLERQLALLSTAPISTIHAFCQSLIRQYFYILDLDPRFRIAGETEIELIKSDILEKLFEGYYEQGDEQFLHLAEIYGDDAGDDPLYNLVLSLYEFSRSHPWPEYWLDEISSRFRIDAECSLDDTPWSRLIREKITFDIEESQRKLQALLREAFKPGGPAAYADTFRSDWQVLEDIRRAAGLSWDSLGAALSSVSFEKIAKAGGEVSQEAKDRLQKERNKIKDKIRQLREQYFSQTPEEWLEDMRKTAPVIESLVRLVKSFGDSFAKTKAAKGILDFSDLEHLALKILLAERASPGNMIPSAVALELADKFTEVMVDEYQDINSVQEAILQLLSSPKRRNRFMVGDVKQSIYRFRLAEPSLFMQKYHDFRGEGSGDNRRIDLSRNYRSRANILDAVNFLFAQLMTPRVAELSYGAAEKLYPGPDYPVAEHPLAAGAVELHLLDCDAEDDCDMAGDMSEEPGENESDYDTIAAADEERLTRFEREARLIAARIRELKSSGSYIFDKTSKSYRPVEWRDMVILLRSVKGKANLLQEALRQCEIPCYAELDAGYFKETEVQVVVSLLSIIDNPRQDIHLAGVLRSPLGGFSAAELAEIRLCRTNGELWKALRQYAQEHQSPLSAKAAAFLAKLDGWRRLSRRTGVADIIWTIYRDTGYYDYVGGMPGGMVRQANLRAMYDRARQFEASNYRGLFRFLRFIERLRDKGSDLSVARALGENENVLRIMSIHKSKGLEFPVVVVADLGKGINLQDSKAPVVCHKTLGAGPYLVDANLRYRYPTIARLAIQHKLNMEAKAEELRILYVALTRAREKLILVGSAEKLAAKCAVWCSEVGRPATALPDSLLASASSYLDWIGPAVARHKEGKELRAYGGCEEEPGSAIAAHPGNWNIVIRRGCLAVQHSLVRADNDDIMRNIAALQPIDTGRPTEWVDKILGWRYPYHYVSGKPAKLTVTEIKRRLEGVNAGESERWYETANFTARPGFIQKNRRLNAVEIGTVMHTVMQHLSFPAGLDPDAIRRQLQSMIENEILLPQQAEYVDVAAIAAFFATFLGQRLLQAGWVKREMPFSLMLPANRFYPEMPEGEEQIFVQGVIDCLFKEDEALVLIDYKTDHNASATELAEKYKIQMDLYGEAAERILRRPVREKYLYVFAGRQVIRI